MTYNFDTIIDRSGTNSLKWEFMDSLEAGAGPDTLPFWVADMDFPCPQPVIDALHARVDRLIFGYSSHRTPEFHAAVRGWYERRLGWSVDADAMVFSPGVVPAIHRIIDILTEPGEGILIQPPVYYPFANAIRRLGRRIVENPLALRNGGYEMDLDDLDRKAHETGARLLILSSPHNPVGRVWRKEELAALLEVCRRRGVRVLSDEIHGDLTRTGVRHLPTEKANPAYRDQIITAVAPSKTFNLAGLQMSIIVIHDKEIRAKWQTYAERMGAQEPNPLSIAAVQAAYSRGDEWLDQCRVYLDGNADFLSDFLAERLPKARYRPAEGTYLAWIDAKDYGDTSAGLVRRLVREGRVLFEAGSLFGTQGEGFLRVNLACPRSILEEGFDRAAWVLEPRKAV